MNRQLLRNSTVVIEVEGRAYIMSALSRVSGGTSIGETSKKRKTLFSNTPRQYSTTTRINPSTIQLDVNVTDSGPEALFFELVGLDVEDASGRLVLPDSVNSTTKLFSMYITNEDGSVIRSDNNFVEAIDFTMDKTSLLVLRVSISSAGLVKEHHVPTLPLGLAQGAIRKPSYVDFRLGTTEVSTVVQANISLQQEAEWLESKSLFDAFGRGNSVYAHKTAATSDIILSATVISNYRDDESDIGVSSNQNLYLCKSGLSLCIDNARIVSNLDLQSIYSNRLDVSISEDTGNTYFYFGEQ